MYYFFLNQLLLEAKYLLQVFNECVCVSAGPLASRDSGQHSRPHCAAVSCTQCMQHTAISAKCQILSEKNEFSHCLGPHSKFVKEVQINSSDKFVTSPWYSACAICASADYTRYFDRSSVYSCRIMLLLAVEPHSIRQ